MQKRTTLAIGSAIRGGSPELDVHGMKNVPASALADALGALEQFLRRFVVLPRREALIAVVLWIAHTYAIEQADATPYLAISSPEKQSGKTRLLECLTLLAHGCTGILIAPTASTIYRSLEASAGATLLLDELDAVFRDRSDRYEEVRAVINAGHRRGATVPRSIPGPKSTWLVKQFPVFGPKALAGIGKLPDTITDRAIAIRMLKRKRSEPIEKFRQRTAAGEAALITASLEMALSAQPPGFEAELMPELPDRAADAWEPLLAIAEAAGGDWPTLARRAAVVLNASHEQDDSLGLRLLADVRLVFEARDVERISTADLMGALSSDDEGPWADPRFPLSPHRLGRLLGNFEIGSKQLRIDGISIKGFERVAFADSWERYLPPKSPSESKHRSTEAERSFDVSLPSERGEVTIDTGWHKRVNDARKEWNLDSLDLQLESRNSARGVHRNHVMSHDKDWVDVPGAPPKLADERRRTLWDPT